VTPAEQIAMNHLVENARAWRWTRTEILESARHHASLNPYDLRRLPELMQAEIDKQKTNKVTQ
jgi:hypothetical protein